MEKTKKELISYVVYYFLIFFLIPFVVLGSGLFLKGFDWYIKYMIVIFPVSFLFFLWNYKKWFKDKINNFKRGLVFIWIIFFLTYLFSGLYIYIIMILALSNFRGF